MPFNDLVKSAAENLTLRGKPKIFFLCACRGSKKSEVNISAVMAC